jgi:hypothetical protein
MKNITDFLLNIFLQLHVFAYGKQVLPDFVMQVHSENAQEIKQTIWLYSINDNKISNFQADSTACHLVHLVLFRHQAANLTNPFFLFFSMYSANCL